MMTDKMIDEALVEILRAKRALEALRAARRAGEFLGHMFITGTGSVPVTGKWTYKDQRAEHAAAKRASLDLTRKLAQLRRGD